MCGSTVDIHCTTAEIRQGKKEERKKKKKKKEETTGQKYNVTSATQGSHNDQTTFKNYMQKV